MFEDQTVEMLPARTTMKCGGQGPGQDPLIVNQSGNVSIAIAINAGNINFGSGDQTNIAAAVSLAGSNVG